MKSLSLFVDSQLLSLLVLFHFVLLAKFKVKQFLHVRVDLIYKVKLLV
jgi:hypothetical protein